MLYQNLKITRNKADAEIRGELTPEAIAAHEAEVLNEARKDFEMPGFRKGHAPLEVVKQHVNAVHVLEDAAERALQEAYPAILEEVKLTTIGGPHATFTKIAPGNPVEFKIEIALIPEIKLPDYSKIAQKAIAAAPKPAVSDEEVQKVVDDLRRLRAVKEAPFDLAQDKKGTSEEHEHKDGEEHDHDHEKAADPVELPELTDEFVKTLGKFENVADFRAQLKENILREKEAESRVATREKIAEALIAATKFEVAKNLVEEEAASAISRLMGELKTANITLEDYLKRISKDEKGLADEYRHAAELQYKTRFILDAIAEKENLAPSDEEIAAEMGALLSRYPELDRDHARIYVTNKLRNEKVLLLLEKSA